MERAPRRLLSAIAFVIVLLNFFPCRIFLTRATLLGDLESALLAVGSCHASTRSGGTVVNAWTSRAAGWSLPLGPSDRKGDARGRFVLSTCNRSEIYAAPNRMPPQACSRFISESRGVVGPLAPARMVLSRTAIR